MKNLASAFFLATALVVAVHGHPHGAPSGACNSIYPQHEDAVSENIEASPFELDISELLNNGGYEPGKEYTRKLNKKRLYYTCA